MSALDNLVVNLIPTGNLSLILALVWVINKDYAKYTISPLTIGQYDISETSRWYHKDLIETILVRATNHQSHHGGVNIKFQVEAKHTYSGNEYDNVIYSQSPARKDKAIWFLDSLEAFNQLETDLLDHHNEFVRNGFFCIVYTGAEIERLDNIRAIFRRLFVIYVLNVNVFLIVGKSAFVYTYFPYAKGRCHSATPQYYLSFRTIREHVEFKIDKPFFPNKLRNMHGCRLVVTTWTHAPYVFVEKDEQTGNVISLKGIEGNIMSLLAEEMNFKMRILEPPTQDRGYVYENGTSTGAAKMIIDGKSNITFVSTMYDKPRSEAMVAAYSYMSFPLIVAIPKGLPMSPYERLTKPFKYIIWSCLSSSILFGIFVILSLKFLGKTHVSIFVFGHLNRTPLTNLWNTLFGGTVQGTPPRRNFARYILAVWLLYTMVLRSAYMSELFIMLQDGRARITLNLVSEVVDKDYTFFTTPVLESILRATVSSVKVRYFDTEAHTFPKLLAELQAERTKIVLTMLEPTLRAYNQNKSNYNRRVNALPEQLITVPVTLYMRKHSYLKYLINDLLMAMMSAGIVRKFESTYLENNADLMSNVQVPTVLSLWLLLGLFSVYFVLLFLCVLVFLLELWSTRSVLVRNTIDFFNC